MKNKFIFLAIFAALLVLPYQAFAENLIDAAFESNPLFGQANFLPGDSVTKWVKVKNVYSTALPVRADLVNFVDEGGLGSQFDIAIKEHGASSNIYANTLAALYSGGGAQLAAALAPNTEIQYDITITFKPEAGNDYQNKSLSFDFVLVSSTEGGEIHIYGGGGGGGGGGTSYYPPIENKPLTFEGLKYQEPGLVAGEQTLQVPGSIDEQPAFVAKGGSKAEGAGEVLGAETARVAAGKADVCTPYYWWWFAGYIVYALLLFGAFWLLRRYNKWWVYVAPAVLFAAAILWWWFEPCSSHLWYWPAAIAVIYIVLAWWHRWYYAKHISTQPVPDLVDSGLE